MLKPDPTYFYVYIITNSVSGKQYVGSKICYLDDHHNDNYHGTSKYLDKEIKKLGWENFEKEILEFYDTPEKMRQGEIDKILGYNTLEPNGYNRHLPPDKFHTNGISVYEIWVLKYGEEEADRRLKEAKRKMSISRTGEKNAMYGRKHTPESIEKNRKSQPYLGKQLPKIVRDKISLGTQGENNPFFGKQHSKETIERIKKKQTGKKYSAEVNKKKGRSKYAAENGMFGRVWITNNIENKIILKDELNNY